MSDWDSWVETELTALRGANLERVLRPVRVATADGPVHVTVDDRKLTLFSANDYLGLSSHPEVLQAAQKAAEQLGMGPRGSPLVCGYTEQHAALETDLATLKGTQSALLYATGFAANVSVITSLADADCEVFSDALNHASIIDGCRLARRSGAKLTVFRHADLDDLESKLRASNAPRKLVVTDGLFSMDGDLAPLAGLAQLRAQFGFLLVVDDAHGTLVFGDRGQGTAHHLGVSEHVDIHVGTLSKAFGAHGGFVACSDAFRALFLNRGRPYVFSTATPIPVIAAARTALRIATDEPTLRQKLWLNIRRFAGHLGHAPTSPIVPVILGEETSALRVSNALWQAGFHVPAIRPPTVAPGTCRLRVALSAAHSTDEIDALADAIREGLIP